MVPTPRGRARRTRGRARSAASSTVEEPVPRRQRTHCRADDVREVHVRRRGPPGRRDGSSARDDRQEATHSADATATRKNGARGEPETQEPPPRRHHYPPGWRSTGARGAARPNHECPGDADGRQRANCAPIASPRGRSRGTSRTLPASSGGKSVYSSPQYFIRQGDRARERGIMRREGHGVPRRTTSRSNTTFQRWHSRARPTVPSRFRQARSRARPPLRSPREPNPRCSRNRASPRSVPRRRIPALRRPPGGAAWPP